MPVVPVALGHHYAVSAGHDLADRSGFQAQADAARLIEAAIQTGFEASRLHPMEFGGDQGTAAVAKEVVALVEEARA